VLATPESLVSPFWKYGIMLGTPASRWHLLITGNGGILSAKGRADFVYVICERLL